jgi:hypothetical protein|tara:strand:+ start:353 stop:736 length:384 start_codon:yes stop_codon:yes gene_type:complete
MTKLCPRGKAAAKRKFAVYPSAYANAYASKICAGKIKDPSGKKRKDFRGPKPAKLGAMMKYKTGNQVKINKVAGALRKASKLHAAQAKVLSTVKAKEGTYIGSHIKSEVGGKKVSNKSYESYYKGMI